LVDESVDGVNACLGEGKRKTEGYMEFLRCFGIIGRTYSKRTAWCLLGVGAIPITMANSPYFEHALSADVKGIFM